MIGCWFLVLISLTILSLKSNICQELANSLDLQTRQNLSSFMDAIEKILMQQSREELNSSEPSQK